MLIPTCSKLIELELCVENMEIQCVSNKVYYNSLPKKPDQKPNHIILVKIEKPVIGEFKFRQNAISAFRAK